MRIKFGMPRREAALARPLNADIAPLLSHATTRFARDQHEKGGEPPRRTFRYASTEQLPQTRRLNTFTMVTLLQRPPLAMFDPSLIHRKDEIFNPEPNRLGIFFALHLRLIIAYFIARIERKSSATGRRCCLSILQGDPPIVRLSCTCIGFRWQFAEFNQPFDVRT